MLGRVLQINCQHGPIRVSCLFRQNLCSLPGYTDQSYSFFILPHAMLFSVLCFLRRMMPWQRLTHWPPVLVSQRYCRTTFLVYVNWVSNLKLGDIKEQISSAICVQVHRGIQLYSSLILETFFFMCYVSINFLISECWAGQKKVHVSLNLLESCIGQPMGLQLCRPYWPLGLGRPHCPGAPPQDQIW